MNIHFALILFLCKSCVNIVTSCNADCQEAKTCQLPTTSMTSCFEELSRCTTYVDKTLFIEEFFKSTEPGQFHLITNPPRYGKTANLDMMFRFLHDNNMPLDLFKSSHFMISPLLEKGNEFLSHHYKNHKCIYISFKSSAENGPENPIIGLRDSLARCYRYFKSEKSHFAKMYDETQKQVYQDIETLMEEIMNDNEPLTEHVVIYGLVVLTRVLSEFDKNITILIDDYDEPIRNAIENNYDVVQAINLVEKILSNLFATPHPNLNYAIITGTLNVLDECKFSNVKPWNFLDGNSIFTPYFGFTADEVDHLLDKYDVQSDIKYLVKYRNSEYNTSNPNTQIYNQYSIVQNLVMENLNDGQCTWETYWIKATKGRIANFLKNIKNNENFSEIIAYLLDTNKITFNLIKFWSPEDLEELRKIIHDNTCTLTVRRVNLILSYLFHNGYLSYADKPRTYSVPNEEIRIGLNQAGTIGNDEAVIDIETLKFILSPAS